MNWLSYIFPKTIARLSSPYNRDIRINLESNRYKLLVNGARESGAYIEGLWRFAFDTLGISLHPAKNILVLGVAGGTAIHLLHAMYPASQIIGVDIDQVMIDVGRKYFGLGNLPSLHLIRNDAGAFVTSYKGHRFDIIIVDLFIGPDVPDVVLSSAFQQNIQSCLTKDGRVMINYLKEPGYEKKALVLQKVLRRFYRNVTFVDRYNNRFFLASPKPRTVVKSSDHV